MGKSVLIVDNDEQVRRAISEMLDFCRPSFEKQVAGNGIEALRKIASGFIPDIIICDVSMPVMSGIALHHAFSQSDFEFRWLFTAASFNYRVRRFLYEEQVPVLLKPFWIKELNEALEIILAEE